MGTQAFVCRYPVTDQNEAGVHVLPGGGGGEGPVGAAGIGLVKRSRHRVTHAVTWLQRNHEARLI